MGRTATAFLVLFAVGGCVADNQGPAAFQTAQMGQSPASASCYATWSKPDQFAVLHDDSTVSPRQTAAVALNTPPMPLAMTAAGPKQLPAPTPAPTPNPLPPALTDDAMAMGGVTPLPPPPVPMPAVAAAGTMPAMPTMPAKPAATPPAATPNDYMIDPDLVRATMVQSSADHADATDPRVVKMPAKTPQTKNVEPEVGAAPASTASASAASPTVRMVNTKRITLNYELKDVENSGVSGVELWCTRDGHAWEHGEIVAQTNHSFSVEVKEEGLHGFTLVARNPADPGKDAPAPGDHPQIWVMADFTKPVVQITGVAVAHSGKAPGVQIHWTAKDKNIGFRPITLSYSEQPEGPWTAIASGIENNGQYDWQPPATAPHRLFLKVEAVDLAGNTAAVQTANALRLDSLLTVAAPVTPSPLVTPTEPAHRLTPIVSVQETPRSDRTPPPLPVPEAPRSERMTPLPLPVSDAPRLESVAPPAPEAPPAPPAAAILNVEPTGN